MAYNLKAWAVVCFLIFLARIFLRPAFCPDLLPKDTFDRLTWAWIGVTTAVFLSFNFWLFCAAAAGVFFYTARKVSVPVALCGLLYSAPFHEKIIPGIGGINYFSTLSYPRVLLIVILINHFMTRGQREKNHSPWGIFDTLVLGVGFLNFFLAYRDDTLTNSLRIFLYHIIDIFGIYWIGRKWMGERKQLVSSLSAFVYGASIISMIAFLECIKKWMFYANTDVTWESSGAGVYLMRGDTGLIRAYASTGHPLALGYVIAVCVFIWLAVIQGTNQPAKKYWRPLALIGLGLVAPVSRGPWVCVAAAFSCWLIVQPKGLLLIGRAALIGAFALGIVLLTPAGDTVINLIPWVGDVESSNIDYRKRLVEVSWMVVMENPWFGSNTFMSEPIMQQLIQGQGIIDLVNHYASTALAAGFVGVALFVLSYVGPGVLGMLEVFKYRHADARKRFSPELNSDIAILRGLACVLLVSAVELATTSAITVIPWTCWLLTGTCVTVLTRVQQQTRMRQRFAPLTQAVPG